MTFFRSYLKGMKRFGESIGIIINTIALSIVYILGIGITALVAKIVGKKFLVLRSDKKSYWTTLSTQKKPVEDYYRQF